MGKVIMSGIAPLLKAPVTGILAQDLAVGSVVKLMEGGTAVEYIVVNQGKPSGSSLYDDSCDGTWLLRKDIHSNRVWNSTGKNVYENSSIDVWLNGDFFNSLGATERTVIKQVKIPYRSGGGSGGTNQSGANGLPRNVFLLGFYEVGFATNSYFQTDSAKLDYFESGTTTSAKSKRIAYLNGTASYWWLRTPNANNTAQNAMVRTSGSNDNYNSSQSRGIRPALVLPKTALFDETTVLLKGVA